MVEATRRSGRERKSIVKFSEDPTISKTAKRAPTKGKGKASNGTNDNAVAGDQPENEEQDELAPSEDEEPESEEEEEDYVAPKTVARKPKAQKRAATASKTKKRKAAALDSDNADPESQNAAEDENEPLLKGEYTIAHDNDLFEAVRHHESALEATVQEWIESYQAEGDASEESKGEPLAQLINFVIRVRFSPSQTGFHLLTSINTSVAVAMHPSISTKCLTSTVLWTSSLKSKTSSKRYAFLTSFLTQNLSVTNRMRHVPIHL